MTALRAFREAFMTAGMEGFEGDVAFSAIYNFEAADARVTRYDVLWAYYQGNAYRELHKWGKKMKAEYGLYTYIRDIYNPANRICNFHQTHIWGGHLDIDAGDGSEVPTALPILETKDNVRKALSQLWRWSRWGVKKDIITLYGSVFGDVFIRIVDMPDRELVYLDRVHPAWVVDIRKNELEEIMFYEMAYSRIDPEKDDGSSVLYTERATLVEDVGVMYETYRNNQPYAWNGEDEEWVVDYPFIPMVHVKHNDVGLDWGWSEMFPKLSTFRELDDQASKLGDQIRKMVDSPWLFTGIRPGRSGGTVTIEGLGDENSPKSSEITREETPILYAHDAQARAYPLVSELDIEAALGNVKEIQMEVEKSYPELRTSMRPGTSSGDVSGRALLLARQEAEDKVYARRVNYDDMLIRAHRMAIAIGGEAKYEGFGGFSYDDWNSEGTEHQLRTDRHVFKPHPSEALDQVRQLWTNASLAAKTGVGLEVFLKDQQWDEKRIKEIIDSEFYKLYLAGLAAQAQPTGPSTDDMGEGEARGDVSGRKSPSGGQDFDVRTNKSREG